MSEYKDYFIYAKICICKKDLKNFKIFLTNYDESGVPILLDAEKSKFSLTCKFCNSFNRINLQ